MLLVSSGTVYVKVFFYVYKITVHGLVRTYV